MASGPISTGLRIAFVDLILTILSSESGLTRAVVAVYSIDAGSAIHARALSAVLIVDLAIHSREAKWTSASIGIDVLIAGGPVLAGEGEALVDVDLTALALESF